MRPQLNRTEHKVKQKHNAADCPDCGGHKLVAVDYRYKCAGVAVDEWLVYCKRCGRESNPCPSFESAIVAWNSGNGTGGNYGAEEDD